jgi:hypothetical protein
MSYPFFLELTNVEKKKDRIYVFGIISGIISGIIIVLITLINVK